MSNEQRLFRYITALEHGDFETIAEIWMHAAGDSELMADLLEINHEMNGKSMYISEMPISKKKRSIPKLAAILILGVLAAALLALFTRQEFAQIVPASGTTPTASYASTPGVTPTDIPQEDMNEQREGVSNTLDFESEDLEELNYANIARLEKLDTAQIFYSDQAMWAPDGSTIVSYGFPGFWLYDYQNANAEPRFIDVGLKIEHARYDGEVIVFSSGSTVYVLDVEAGEIIDRIETTTAIDHLLYQDGLMAYVANTSAENADYSSVVIWDVPEQRARFHLQYLGAIQQIRFDPDAAALVVAGPRQAIEASSSGSTLPSILIHNTENGELINSFPLPQRNISVMAVTSDSIVIGNSSDLYQTIGDVATGQLQGFGEIAGNMHLDTLYLGVFRDQQGVWGSSGRDDLLFFILENDRTVELVSSENDILSSNIVSSVRNVDEISIHPHLPKILLPGLNSFKIVNILTGMVEGKIPILQNRDIQQIEIKGTTIAIEALGQAMLIDVNGSHFIERNYMPFSNLVLGTNSSYFVTLTDDNQTSVVAWDHQSNTYEVLATRYFDDTGFAIESNLSNLFFIAALSEDNRLLAFSTGSNVLKFFDLEANRFVGQKRVTSDLFSGLITSITFSPDDQFVTITTIEDPTMIHIYDLMADTFLVPLDATSDVIDISFGETASDLYVLTTNRNLTRWRDWQVLDSFSLPFIANAIALSPNGQLLVAAGEDLLVLDASTLREIGYLQAEADISAVQFNDEGQWLVAADQHGLLSIWGVRP